MCKDNCKCNKCKNKFLPISGRDVLYYGLPLEIINVEYGENYEEILIKLNKLISEITTDKESSDLFFSNIGNGIGILKGINEFNQVEFKSLISDGSIDIQTDDKTITLKTIYNFKIVEDVNEANTYLSVENEGKLVYIKQTDKYYKIKNLELSDPFPTKLETPTQDGVDGPEYKVPAYLPDGSAYWRSATDFGKVDTVNNIKPDNNRNVTLKISDLEDDKGLALLSDLNNEINNRINSYNELQQSINTEKSERISADELLNSKIDTTKTELNSSFDNKISQESTERVDADTVLDNKITTERTERIDADKLKLDKPTTVGTTTSHPHVVGVDSNGNSAKLTATDFGKVDGIRVNGIKQPLATDRYVDLNQEFVKNGGGWSTKYKQDNPDKYEITGENAVDLTKAYPNSTKKFGAKGKDSFAVGAYNLAGGMGSLSMGYGTETYGNISIATGYLNKTYSAYTTIFGGSQNTIGTESEITNPITSLNSRAIIAGGQFNSIVNGKGGTIIGGYQNTIDAGNKYNNSTNPLAYNSILGGYLNTINNSENSIIVGGSRNKINQSGEKVITSFVTGQDNETQGSFTTVFGYRNKAVTQGETIVGFGATIQDESLLPTTYYDNSRMFAVGVGILNSNNTLNRRDGLSVYQNGLVTTPTANNNNIENNPKAVTTKEFVDNKISNFSLPTNWSNPFVRYSGLLDKSAEATFNQLLGSDSNGNMAKVGLNAVTNAMSKSTDAQKDAWRLAQRKTGEIYSTSQPRVDFLFPNIIKNESFIQYIRIKGSNLFIDTRENTLSWVKLRNKVTLQEYLVPIVNVIQTDPTYMSFGIDFSNIPLGVYLIKIYNHQLQMTNADTTELSVVDYLDVQDLPPLVWNKVTDSSVTFDTNDYELDKNVYFVVPNTPHISVIKPIKTLLSQPVLTSEIMQRDFILSFKITSTAWNANFGGLKIGLVEESMQNQLFIPFTLNIYKIFVDKKIEPNGDLITMDQNSMILDIKMIKKSNLIDVQVTASTGSGGRSLVVLDSLSAKAIGVSLYSKNLVIGYTPNDIKIFIDKITFLN